MDEGKLPIEKISFGPRAVGFRKTDVEKWINGELEDEPQKTSA
jgi:predicted DNA-binding transcriptional regulator AlpA